eukprot:Blabericola_migrator_1__12335@NODE_772_length_6579_cov_9_106419_g549_i0_p9_GENE_NODE_772_length_6579_cov_9_106419_g549_i0NODE_772_length_6579_cov_9_106419_g549_i0_p9_ORF_typecomplete_len111_score5_97DUF2834/PF11196_8/3e03DUF2834/PF11196_8/0_51_NODE_772_length_6579_cov_9_106419_g549_i035643896
MTLGAAQSLILSAQLIFTLCVGRHQGSRKGNWLHISVDEMERSIGHWAVCVRGWMLVEGRRKGVRYACQHDGKMRPGQIACVMSTKQQQQPSGDRESRRNINKVYRLYIY